MNNSRDWAKALLAQIRFVEGKAKLDERSTPGYWSAGDSFMSLSDFKDATDFVDDQIIDCILKHAKPKVKQ